MRKVTITEEEWHEKVRALADGSPQVRRAVGELMTSLFPPAPQWIFDRRPTEAGSEDGERDGELDGADEGKLDGADEGKLDGADEGKLDG